MAEPPPSPAPSPDTSRDAALAEVMRIYSPSSSNPNLPDTVALADSETDDEDGTVCDLAAAAMGPVWVPRPVLDYLSAELAELAEEMPLPDGRTVRELLAGLTAANASSASLVFDHWACQSLRHQATLARHAAAELALALAAKAAATAVEESLRAATAEAAQALTDERCNVLVLSRKGGKCLSPWRSCPVLSHARARSSCGLPAREPVPCSRHPRLIRAACRVCAERRRLRLLFTLHR